MIAKHVSKRAILIVIPVAATMLLMIAQPALVQATARVSRPLEQTVTLNAAADATLISLDATQNYGSNELLGVAYGYQSTSGATALVLGKAVALLNFDVSSIPTDSVIDSAVLELYLASASGADPVNLSLYVVQNPWDEYTATWSSPTMHVGQYGLTWQLDKYPGYKSIGIEGFVSSWINGSNYGMMLRGPFDEPSLYSRTFGSRESGNGPRLVVSYHLPQAELVVTPRLSLVTNVPPPPSAPTSFILMGKVFKGEVNDQSQPLRGLTVEAYGSNNPYPNTGRWLTSATTDQDGHYELNVSAGDEYYFIHLPVPPGYQSVGATTGGGLGQSNEWIEFHAPLDNQTLFGNWFWIKPIPTQPPKLPDLFVSTINDWHYDPPSQSLILNASIRNSGEAWANSSLVQITAPDVGYAGTQITVRDLGPSQQTDITTKLSVFSGWLGKSVRFHLAVDPYNQVAESSEDNNAFSLPPVYLPYQENTPAPTARPRPTTPPNTPKPVAPPPAQPPAQPSAPSIDFFRPEVIALVVTAVALLWGLAHVLRRPPKAPRQSGRPPILPVIPPPRLIKIWLSEGRSGTGRILKDDRPLKSGEMYSLHVQVLPPGFANGARGANKPRKGSVASANTKLDVVFFSPATDFALSTKTDQLDLPANGPSNEIRCAIAPRDAGQRRVRVCVYYRNVLLQSAVLDANVVSRKQRGQKQQTGISRLIDYVASASLSALNQLPRVAVNVFANEAVNGTHWIGVYSADASSRLLRTGDLHVFEASELTSVASKTREVLLNLEGDRGRFRYQLPLPLNEQAVAQVESDLVKLAINGWKMYSKLFISGDDQGDDQLLNDRLKALEERLETPSIISVAHCRHESATVPWSALYSLFVDSNRSPEIKLCNEFRAQLLSNEWSTTAGLTRQRDLLDSPQVCRNLPQCRLKTHDTALMVCPFGFWGLMHQIEQPLHQVTPMPVDQANEQLRADQGTAEITHTAWVLHRHTDRGRIAIAACPDLPGAAAHRAELEALCTSNQIEVAYQDDREQILRLLKRGDQHLYYFYCHGEIRDREFQLKFGPVGHVGYISADNLDPRHDRWSSGINPLIILNGCETMAVTPELIHGFMGTLRRMGASGVVGTEIPVSTLLAQPFGRWLIERFIAGQSIGEAFLDLRRHLLRLGNPLGLAYSFYSLASLHLHDLDSCSWCRSHAAQRN